MEIKVMVENIMIKSIEDLEGGINRDDGVLTIIDDYSGVDDEDVVSFSIETGRTVNGPKTEISFILKYDDAYAIGKVLAAMSETYHMYWRETIKK